MNFSFVSFRRPEVYDAQNCRIQLQALGSYAVRHQLLRLWELLGLRV